MFQIKLLKLSKRIYPSGPQERKMKLESEASAKKSKIITSFFTPQQKEKKVDGFVAYIVIFYG